MGGTPNPLEEKLMILNKLLDSNFNKDLSPETLKELSNEREKVLKELNII